jgi:hypothetical protein
VEDPAHAPYKVVPIRISHSEAYGKNRRRLRNRKEKMPYQINGIIVRTHRGMDVELGVRNRDPQCKLDALLDLGTTPP